MRNFPEYFPKYFSQIYTKFSIPKSQLFCEKYRTVTLGCSTFFNPERSGIYIASNYIVGSFLIGECERSFDSDRYPSYIEIHTLGEFLLFLPVFAPEFYNTNTQNIHNDIRRSESRTRQAIRSRECERRHTSQPLIGI